METIRVPKDWQFSRIREDIDSGRLWKARDRLQGHLSTDHADQDVLDILGSVCFAMGDLPQAGRHWFLTERSDAAASAARGAFYERFSHDAGHVLRALRVLRSRPSIWRLSGLGSRSSVRPAAGRSAGTRVLEARVLRV